MRTIDLNFDGGEGFDDHALAPLVTTIHIACGGHTGNETTMRSAVRLAREHGLSIGAHPSFPDREGFGRRAMDLAPSELMPEIEAQLLRLIEVAESEGMRVSQLKPHGALYHRVAKHDGLAFSLVEQVALIDRRLVLVGPPASSIEAAARDTGLRFLREGYADRRYQPNGSLVPRSESNALIDDPLEAAEQALRLEVESICVHSDTPAAHRIAAAVRDTLTRAHYRITAP